MSVRKRHLSHMAPLEEAPWQFQRPKHRNQENVSAARRISRHIQMQCANVRTVMLYVNRTQYVEIAVITKAHMLLKHVPRKKKRKHPQRNKSGRAIDILNSL